MPTPGGYAMSEASDPLRGRGTSGNPGNRFESLHYEPDPDAPADETPAPATRFYRDATRSIIATNDSPDVGFSASINPYRGCEHGCIYCFARPTHEYAGFSLGLDFESKILVKEDAPRLLRRELNARRWRPQTLGVCGVTDPYQPIERHLRLTRRCLEVLAEFRNPACVITKSRLVTRDADLLGALARDRAALACVSVTTLDCDLARVMEPRATQPPGRLDAVRALTAAGVPVTVLVAPVIPGLTDHELPAILAAARAAGAVHAGYVMLRLPYGLADLFERWLGQHFPERKERVLGRLRGARGGRHNDPRFGSRMRGEGPLADVVAQVFKVAYRRLGFPGAPALSADAFRRPGDTPPRLFD
jgi:DNA repair photolyase